MIPTRYASFRSHVPVKPSVSPHRSELITDQAGVVLLCPTVYVRCAPWPVAVRGNGGAVHTGCGVLPGGGGWCQVRGGVGSSDLGARALRHVISAETRETHDARVELNFKKADTFNFS